VDSQVSESRPGAPGVRQDSKLYVTNCVGANGSLFARGRFVVSQVSKARPFDRLRAGSGAPGRPQQAHDRDSLLG